MSDLTNKQQILIKVLVGIFLLIAAIGFYMIADKIVKDNDSLVETEVESDNQEETESEEEVDDELEAIIAETELVQPFYESGRETELSEEEYSLLDILEESAEEEINSLPDTKEKKAEMVTYSKLNDKYLGLLSGDFIEENDFYIDDSLKVIDLFNDRYVVYQYCNSDEYIVFRFPDDWKNPEYFVSLGGFETYSLLSSNCNFKVDKVGEVGVLWVKGL